MAATCDRARKCNDDLFGKYLCNCCTSPAGRQLERIDNMPGHRASLRKNASARKSAQQARGSTDHFGPETDEHSAHS